MKINSKIRKIFDFNKNSGEHSNVKVCPETESLDSSKDYLRQVLHLSMDEVYSAANKVD